MTADTRPPRADETGARPASPCIRVCHLEEDTCLGCRRTLDEIARWSRMSEAEKARVWQRLEREGEAAPAQG